MKDLVVSARVPAKDDRPEMVGTVTVQTGETAAEKIQMFGDAAVSSNADANWIVTIQRNIREGLKRGETPEALQARLGGMKMGVAAQKAVVDTKAAYLAEFAAATPERQKEMLAELKAAASKG